MKHQKSQQHTSSQNTHKRAPVVAVLGHIDHGKSTLLDYILKTHVTDSEVGGITQKITAYEVDYTNAGTTQKITFIDTPGHEAFSGMRERGATTADVAILIVSAEDGVKKQTIEAYKQIKDAGTPFVVALTKIDKPNADIERAKASLAENEIYVEGYGGNISYVPISSKTGEGIPELLELVLLTAEVAGLTGDVNALAEGAVIEAHRDPKKGTSATLIIKNGSLKTGMYVACGRAFSPVRILEDFRGKPLKEAQFSSPVRVVGWNETPHVGKHFVSFENKKALEAYLETYTETNIPASSENSAQSGAHVRGNSSTHAPGEQRSEKTVAIPLIIKADVAGSLEAIMYELQKIHHDTVSLKVIVGSIGDITESDIKGAGSNTDTIIIGFNVKADVQAKAMIERIGIEYVQFDIIYKLIEWIEAKMIERKPKVATEEILGAAKILKFFSSIRDKQIIGGKVTDREIKLGHKVRISRRENVLGEGIIKELQQAKSKTSSVAEGFEFGALIESKVQLAPGDIITDFIIVEK